MSDAFKDFVERREAEIKSKASGGGGTWLWIGLGLVLAVLLIFLVMRGDPATGPVNPNTASVELLATLNGIGPETAKKIVAGRPYEKVEDLLKVPGVGPKTLEKMRQRLKLDR